jgi:hypothetical protein
LRSALPSGADGHSDDPKQIPANAALRMVLETALAGQPFDEAKYLAANPDVARAIKHGKCRSAHEHYLLTGYYEGRDTGHPEFDEAWYLQRYPDVKQAVSRGESKSGLEHYKGPGVREWRSPNKAAEPDIARWRSILAPAKPRPTVKPHATVAARVPA